MNNNLGCETVEVLEQCTLSPSSDASGQSRRQNQFAGLCDAERLHGAFPRHGEKIRDCFSHHLQHVLQKVIDLVSGQSTDCHVLVHAMQFLPNVPSQAKVQSTLMSHGIVQWFLPDHSEMLHSRAGEGEVVLRIIITK